MSTGYPGFFLNPLTRRQEFFGRYQKPGFELVTSTNNKVRVTASANKPAFFIIGGRLQIITSNLDCNFNVTGPGGLDEGTIEANKPYYLYGVISSGEVKLVASKRDPDGEGLQALGEWTYIGAMATVSGSAALPEFTSKNGVFFAEAPIDLQTHTGNTSYNAESYVSMPLTVQAAWIELFSGGTEVAAGTITASPTGTTTNGPLQLKTPVAGATNQAWGYIPIIESQKIYLKTSNSGASANAELYGWMENPSEFK